MCGHLRLAVSPAASCARVLRPTRKVAPQKKWAQRVSLLSPDEVEGVQLAWSPSGRAFWVRETLYIVLYRFDIHRLGYSTHLGAGLIEEPVQAG